jgi:hypothetical protein
MQWTAPSATQFMNIMDQYIEGQQTQRRFNIETIIHDFDAIVAHMEDTALTKNLLYIHACKKLIDAFPDRIKSKEERDKERGESELTVGAEKLGHFKDTWMTALAVMYRLKRMRGRAPFPKPATMVQALPHVKILSFDRFKQMFKTGKRRPDFAKPAADKDRAGAKTGSRKAKKADDQEAEEEDLDMEIEDLEHKLARAVDPEEKAQLADALADSSARKLDLLQAKGALDMPRMDMATLNKLVSELKVREGQVDYCEVPPMDLEQQPTLAEAAADAGDRILREERLSDDDEAAPAANAKGRKAKGAKAKDSDAAKATTNQEPPSEEAERRAARDFREMADIINQSKAGEHCTMAWAMQYLGFKDEDCDEKFDVGISQTEEGKTRRYRPHQVAGKSTHTPVHYTRRDRNHMGFESHVVSRRKSTYTPCQYRNPCGLSIHDSAPNPCGFYQNLKS